MINNLASSACEPVNTRLGYVASITLAAPGLVEEVTEQGYNARMQNRDRSENPYIIDGPYGWWLNGWLAADEQMR